jgi:hypothetical protein
MGSCCALDPEARRLAARGKAEHEQRRWEVTRTVQTLSRYHRSSPQHALPVPCV